MSRFDGAAAGSAAASQVTRWLSLAAAPTFGLMALLTAISGDTDAICSAASAGWPLGGMAAMYLLMGLFHLPPWLKWIASRQKSPANGSERSISA
ncbi:hypothetical protein [Kaistia algarum]|uniref:hypothetical protein n=1 Tax=Kaistia algarum TaxID=2083279 RepID=UPI002B1CF588|nr:hypothetical protein [Kaistia algarum]